MILSILILLILILLINFGLFHNFFKQIELYRLMFTNINNNFESVPFKHRKILIITAEDRNEEYIKLHDESFKKYSKLHNYEYLRLDNCPKEESSTYWCKIYKVKEYLNKYDYVMWVDSDTIITNYNKSLDEFISKFGEPDIIIGEDEQTNRFLPINILNAGVFLIKNSKIGKEFIDDCLNKIPDNCIINNKEQGVWAGVCYEQGIMNILLKTKYKDHFYLDKDKTFIFNHTFNSDLNYDNNFILHLPSSTTKSRNTTFKKYI